MKREEEAIQIDIVALLDVAAVPGLLWWHTPNGGKRGKAEAARFKAMGVKPGVPDLILAFPDRRMAFMEVKAPKGRTSDDQDHFLTLMHDAGHATAVVRSLDEAVEVLNAWRAVRNVKVMA